MPRHLIGDEHEWISTVSIYLTATAGKENPVELDSSLTL